MVVDDIPATRLITTPDLLRPYAEENTEITVASFLLRKPGHFKTTRAVSHFLTTHLENQQELITLTNTHRLFCNIHSIHEFQVYSGRNSNTVFI